jgi:hypothetical protein
VLNDDDFFPARTLFGKLHAPTDRHTLKMATAGQVNEENSPFHLLNLPPIELFFGRVVRFFDAGTRQETDLIRRPPVE